MEKNRKSNNFPFKKIFLRKSLTLLLYFLRMKMQAPRVETSVKSEGYSFLEINIFTQISLLLSLDLLC